MHGGILTREKLNLVALKIPVGEDKYSIIGDRYLIIDQRCYSMTNAQRVLHILQCIFTTIQKIVGGDTFKTIFMLFNSAFI